MEQKRLLTVNDISKELGLSKATIYSLMSKNDFPTIQIGSRKYVTTEDLNNWLYEKAHANETEEK